jgi:hypothetical protein
MNRIEGTKNMILTVRELHGIASREVFVTNITFWFQRSI